MNSAYEVSSRLMAGNAIPSSWILKNHGQTRLMVDILEVNGFRIGFTLDRKIVATKTSSVPTNF